MAGDKKTKIVEFEIRGNTVNLEKEINSALRSIDSLQSKLSTMSTLGKASGGMGRASGIVSNIQTLGGIGQHLTEVSPTLNSPDQVNLVATATEALSRANNKLKGTTAGTSKSMKALGKTLKEVYSGLGMVEKTTTTLTGSIGGMVANMFSIQRIFNVVVMKIKEGIMSAMEFTETVNLFNVAAGDAADTLGSFATNMSKAFSADPNSILKYIGTFNILATSIGGTSEQATLLSENLTMLSYDMASLFNTDVDTMSTAVRSGLTGISKPLKKYGIVITDTVVKQEAAMLGITKSWQNMSEIDKMGLRYLTILRQTSAAHGDLAKTLESPENQFKIFKAQLEVFFRTLGSIALIAGEIIMPVVNGLLIGFNELLGVFSTAAGYEIPNFTNNLSNNTAALGEEEEAADDLSSAMKKLLMPFDELNVLSKESSKSGDLLTLDPEIESLLKGYDNLMSRVTSKAGEFSASLKRALNPELLESFGTIASLVFGAFGLGIDIAVGALNVLSYPISWLTKALEFLLTPITAIIKGWNSADKATKGWARTGGIALGVLGSLIAAMKIYNFVAALGNGVLLQGIKFMGEYIATSIKDIAVTIKKTLAKKAEAMANWWNNASLAAQIMLVSAGIATAVVVAAGIAAAVMYSKAKQTQGDIPAMASGGVVTDATQVLVGEGRYSEAVIPLGSSPQFRSMKDDIAESVASKIGTNNTGNVTVKVYIGEKDFKQYTYKVVSEENRRVSGISLEKLSAIRR